MSNDSELCFNLWAIFDLETQVIYGVAGKAYALQGTDEEKLSVLRNLSVFDYQTVEAVRLPDRFELIGLDGEIKNGATTIQVFHDPTSVMFDELFIHIENQLPNVNDYTKTIPQTLPNEPLCIKTLVCEDGMGNRRAIVTDEDREWLDKVGSGSALRQEIVETETETENDEEVVNDDANSIRSEIKRYFHGHMDMAKAITECNIYVGVPEHCDLCRGNFIDDGFMVDCAIRGQDGWACMCMNCFGQHAQGLGWGVGQLYKNEGKLGWLQVAGFQN